jgi:hypothetical protein
LPPTNYWQQDVVVIHYLEHSENACYNHIFTQCSGNCPIPDDFHQFLLRLTRTFGNRFLTARALISWLDHGQTLEQQVRDEEIASDPRLLASIAQVEAQEGGTIDRSTICLLSSFHALEWFGMLRLPRQDHEQFRVIHVNAEHITSFSSSGAIGDWFREMQDRGYLAPVAHRSMPAPSTGPPAQQE